MVCCSAPTSIYCRSSQHTIIDILEYIKDLEYSLEEKSQQVSNYLKKSAAKREQAHEHLRLKLESIKSLMTKNDNYLEKLRFLMIANQQEAEIIIDTNTPSSIVKDFEKSVKEAKEEVEEAERILNQFITASKIPVSFFTKSGNVNNLK